MWTGLMLVYVDDLLLVAEDETIHAATQAIAEVWALSDVEKVQDGQSIKYCGFEVAQGPERDGFMISQRKYEQEMIQRFEMDQAVQFPNFKVSEGDENPEGPIRPEDIKTAQTSDMLRWSSCGMAIISTDSTAEAELVSYCEALTAGRSMESILCSTCSTRPSETTALSALSMEITWLRSQWLMELVPRAGALDIDGVAPGGLWQLLHLRGTDLVADGLTKPLLVFRLLQDLGMREGGGSSEGLIRPEERASGGGQGQEGPIRPEAAIRALVVGSLLMSQANCSQLAPFWCL
eukprot:s3841_g13.t1